MTQEEFDDQFITLGQFSATGFRYVNDGVDAVSVLIPTTPEVQDALQGYDGNIELVVVVFAKRPGAARGDSA